MQAKRMRMVLAGMTLGLAPLGMRPDPARADVPLSGIQMTYHGGPMMPHVKVVPLLYGSTWTGTTTAAYLKAFLQTVFCDGRYLAGLTQYNAGGYQIGDGTAIDPVIDPAALPKVDAQHAATGIRYQVTDDQIQSEIKAQFSTGKLPPPDANTLYMVCVAYDTVVVAGGSDSETGFAAYHSYATDGGYAYAVAAPTGDDPTQRAPGPTGYTGTVLNEDLTSDISHEMVEVVTSAQGDGWYDDSSGDEIADVADDLANLGFLSVDQYYLLLTGTDGTRYAVETYWSNQGRTLLSF